MQNRAEYLEALGIDLWVARRGGAPAAQMQAEPVVAAPVQRIATPAVAVPGIATARATEPVPAAATTAALAPGVGQGILNGDAWSVLAAEVKDCTKCALSASRTQTVFGVGNREAELMVIGEAPGADEDRQGEPFVGRAGQLLNAMLRALRMPREQVFIANVLKCRPPGNRDPLPEEVACCLGYLQRQVALVKPKLLLAVGRIAAQNLLATDTPIGKLRGQLHRFGDQSTPLVVTYHPAYLLRSPGEKRRAWQDLKFVRAEIARLRA
jgi:uracil-DNA glycosylase